MRKTIMIAACLALPTTVSGQVPGGAAEPVSASQILALKAFFTATDTFSLGDPGGDAMNDPGYRTCIGGVFAKTFTRRMRIRHPTNKQQALVLIAQGYNEGGGVEQCGRLTDGGYVRIRDVIDAGAAQVGK